LEHVQWSGGTSNIYLPGPQAKKCDCFLLYSTKEEHYHATSVGFSYTLIFVNWYFYCTPGPPECPGALWGVNTQTKVDYGAPELEKVEAIMKLLKPLIDAGKAAAKGL
jgi:hypothetical protein